jgi:hypothetical protein
MRGADRTSRTAIAGPTRSAAACCACAALILAQALLPMVHVAQHGPADSAAVAKHTLHSYAGTSAQDETGSLAWTGHERTGAAHDPGHCVLCSLARNGQAGLRSGFPTHLAEPASDGSSAERSHRALPRFIFLNDAPPRGPPFAS